MPVGKPYDGVVAPGVYPPIVEEEVVGHAPELPECVLVGNEHGLPGVVGRGHHEGGLLAIMEK